MTYVDHFPLVGKFANIIITNTLASISIHGLSKMTSHDTILTMRRFRCDYCAQYLVQDDWEHLNENAITYVTKLYDGPVQTNQ